MCSIFFSYKVASYNAFFFFVFLFFCDYYNIFKALYHDAGKRLPAVQVSVND